METAEAPRDAAPELEEVVVSINRCATVTKGGRTFSFSAIVVIGDRRGEIGWGFGKALEVPAAVEKAIKDAKKRMVSVSLDGDTIPHEVTGRYGAARVFMKPASQGTGVIAGASVRAVVESAGVNNILTKCYGTSNPINIVKATFDGLSRLRTKSQVEALRGVKLS